MNPPDIWCAVTAGGIPFAFHFTKEAAEGEFEGMAEDAGGAVRRYIPAPENKF